MGRGEPRLEYWGSERGSCAYVTGILALTNLLHFLLGGVGEVAPVTREVVR